MNEARLDKRSARLLRGAIVATGGERLDLLIKNISHHGVGGRFSGSGLAVGESVQVELPGIGLFDASVRWIRKEAVGLHVEQLIDPETTLFRNNHLINQPTHPYHVPDRFQPSQTAYRPGFRHR